MKVAIVYDRVNKWGGAERVLLSLHEIWPDAPLYTSVYDEKGAGWAKVFPQVKTSFLQKIPFVSKNHELVPFLTPLAFESFNFDEFDLVISVCSAEAKSIITKPHTFHLCYCLTPTRYLWSGYHEYLQTPGLGFMDKLVKIFYPALSFGLRNFDQIAAQRPDEYIAISKTVQNRIKKYYKRDSSIIYPSINTDKFEIRSSKFEKKEDFFLIVSRLVSYKRIDLAIEVFNKLKKKLVIVGKGRDEGRLKSMAGPNIIFVRELTMERLVRYYQDCNALIFPGREDFGLTVLEAMACGKPVIAFQKGGAAETVINKKTGLLFPEQNIASLSEAISEFTKLKFNPSDCREQALKFKEENFKVNFKNEVEDLWSKWKKRKNTR